MTKPTPEQIQQMCPVHDPVDGSYFKSHVLEPRYDQGEVDINKVENLVNLTDKSLDAEVIALLCRQVASKRYIGDVCVQCGRFFPRKED